ncbi:MAG: Scorpion antimicrobial peptide [Cryobacterium sp.]|jgi:hypothetical protein|nr:Scorpion antimicrobial peptide [Cryobacterium sp.]
MRGKLLFITGGLVGYVLGARAGRKRYDQIAAAATDLWNAEPVQRRVSEVRDFALDAVGDAPAKLIDAGKKLASAKLGGTKNSAPGTTKKSANGTPASMATPRPSAANTEQSTSAFSDPTGGTE